MMPSGRDRSRRTSFNDVAELYDRARPRYPEALVDDLAGFAGLAPDSRVLEIGCGTGQLTLALAERGAAILAIELGPALAEHAARNLARFPHATVQVADFDTWQLPPTPFDLVVAATAFHWLNPETRVQKCVAALRPGGTLAIVETHWNAGSGRDRFFDASQDCYRRWDPRFDPASDPRALHPLPPRNDELEDSSSFEQIQLAEYVREEAYTASGYCDLLGTFSDVRAFGDTARAGFLDCIARVITSGFDGSVVRRHIHRTWLARAHNRSHGMDQTVRV